MTRGRSVCWRVTHAPLMGLAAVHVRLFWPLFEAVRRVRPLL